jgi:hypothetical protein
MLRAFARAAGRAGEAGPAADSAEMTNVARCVDALEARFGRLRALQRRCGHSPELQRAGRRFLRNAFFFAMYALGWPGPGTPYPIAAPRALTYAAMSPELRGATAAVTDRGDVQLRELREPPAPPAPPAAPSPPADELRGGVAYAMRSAHLRAAMRSIDACALEARAFLKAHCLYALGEAPGDGPPWPSGSTLWEVLFGPLRRCDGGTPCLRELAARVLRTCDMLALYLYKARPQWMTYKGVL